MLIDGAPVLGEGESISVYNPATEDLLAEVPSATLGQLDSAFASARRAFDEGPWPRMSGAERSTHIDRLADLFERREAELLPTLVSEVGTPITLANAIQIDGARKHLRYFAELAARDLTEELGEHAGPPRSASAVAYRPAGVACAISAYNYPVTIAAWKLGAALAAGCTVVLMPSPRTPLATLLFAEIIAEAELPAGVVNVIVGGPEIARRATERPDIDRISFTGSISVGQAIMRQAANSLAGIHLELGGKSANIILPDFELTKEAVTAMHLRYLRNAGQGCASPTRILIPSAKYDDFLELTRAVYAEVGVGDPWDPGVTVGPVIRPEHRDFVEGFIERAVAEGGEVIAGGGRPDLERGWYVNPTLLGGLTPDAELAQNEAFGPVGIVLKYEDVEQAIAIANGTRYGLAAYVSSPDLERANAVAARLTAGSVYVNGGGALRSDAPFGGFKMSGIGREGGIYGMREFLEVQHLQWAL
jgi:aldehyde dehydrogenase (NAD+)/betaine-aldehyde dehydrogenase